LEALQTDLWKLQGVCITLCDSSGKPPPITQSDRCERGVDLCGH
jgi:hypothetical protein